MIPARRSLSLSARAAGFALALLASTASANPDGRIVDRSRTGCGTTTTCHGATPGATATITGPLTVMPGARSTYTLAINSTLAAFVGGGCDITAPGASVAVNPMQQGTRINGVDLVHNLRLARAPGGPLTILFDVVAPAAPGTFTVYAAGNATNGSLRTGDAWALASLAVTVAGDPVDGGAPVDAAPPADTGAATDAAPLDDLPEPTGDTLVARDPALSEAYGKCSVTPARSHGASGLGALGALAALAFTLRARRR